MRFIFSLLSALPVIIALLFAGIIIDVGLTSIYAHFGWELWPTFTVIGLIAGLIAAVADGYWRLITPLVYAGAGYIFAENWLIDGIIYAVIIIAIYSSIKAHFDPDYRN